MENNANPASSPLDMKIRTRRFAKQVVWACRLIPKTFEGRHVASQLFRSSTSVAANYRAACRARSKREFISKIGLVIEETDETLFWLEFCGDIGLLPDSSLRTLRQEANELVSIFWATRQTAQSRLQAAKVRAHPQGLGR